MAEQTVCPRCGARDSFMKGYLPDTCLCRVCQSQLDWREIPDCGPDCTAAPGPERPGPHGEGAALAGDPPQSEAPLGARGEPGGETSTPAAPGGAPGATPGGAATAGGDDDA